LREGLVRQGVVEETGRNRGRQTADQRGLEERLAHYSTVMASIAA